MNPKIFIPKSTKSSQIPCPFTGAFSAPSKRCAKSTHLSQATHRGACRAYGQLYVLLKAPGPTSLTWARTLSSVSSGFSRKRRLPERAGFLLAELDHQLSWAESYVNRFPKESGAGAGGWWAQETTGAGVWGDGECVHTHGLVQAEEKETMFRSGGSFIRPRVKGKASMGSQTTL